MRLLGFKKEHGNWARVGQDDSCGAMPSTLTMGDMKRCYGQHLVAIFLANGTAVEGIGDRSGRRKAMAAATINRVGKSNWGGARTRKVKQLATMPFVHADAELAQHYEGQLAEAQVNGTALPTTPGVPEDVAAAMTAAATSADAEDRDDGTGMLQLAYD